MRKPGTRKPDTEGDLVLLEAVRSGVSVVELAARYGVTRARIYQRLERADPKWGSGRVNVGDHVVSVEGRRRPRKETAKPRPQDPLSPPATTNRWLLTPGQCADLFAVDPKTISRWARLGRISYTTTLGGHRRYPREEIERLLADRAAHRTP